MKRILAVLSVLALMLTCIALPVYAEDASEPDVFTAFISEAADVKIEGNRVV